MAYIENEDILKEESHNNKILSALNRMIKQLELNLNKRLLIVELPDDQEVHYKDDIIYKIDEEQSKYSLLPKGEFKLLCKGSDLTEDIAKGLVDIDEISDIEDYRHKIVYVDYVDDESAFYTALDAFISAIESNGWYWGNNPVKHPDEIKIQPASLGWWKEQEEAYLNSESRTLTPEKCIIFEIV